MARRRGNFGSPNMGNVMKKMQQIQKQMEETQEKVNETVIEASAGGGVVTCSMNGKRELLSITIDPGVLDPEDVEMVQDMVLVAVNDCLKQVEDLNESEMGRITGGLNIPGL